MKQILISTILTVLIFGKTFACLNGDIMALKNGTFLYEDGEGNVPYGHEFYRESFEPTLKELDSLFKATKDFDYLSDKGLLLILLGRYDEAIGLYLQIEQKSPNRYSTASNIGTAYELIGQNEKALKWIRKSVQLDPKSHKNSEWIHVKILEAKIKGEPFYTSKFLLNAEFGSAIQPVSQMKRKKLLELSDALYYQLNERISFVKPKEKIVAQLLFDLGNIALLLGNHNDAFYDYQQAKLYGYSGQLIEQRIKLAEENTDESKAKAQKRSFYLTIGFSLLAGLLLIVLMTVIYKRKRKNKGLGIPE